MRPRRWACLLLAACLLAGCLLAGCAEPAAPAPQPSPWPSASPPPSSRPAPPVGALPVIDYWTAPKGLPADPLPTAPVTEAVHPTARLVVYDAPGGRPRAFLRRSISGMPVALPIVERRSAWVAVLLPTVNRRIGWLPAGGWSPRPLRDHLVVDRRAHRLTWYRDGLPQGRWTVTTGAPATPTPVGRTFVLGRTPTSGAVYGGLDALVLGSVPDDPRSVPASLRGAHTAIHGWYRRDAFGRSVSNGCIRVPRAGLRTLLNEVAPGTTVHVLD